MDEAARREWLSVAWATLKHLPADLLKRGCAKARETADHPSKIVPAIIAETKETLDWRLKTAREDHVALPPPEEVDRCTPEQAAAILEEFGLKSRFASNRQSGGA